MNGRLALATLGGTIVSFLLGWVVFGMITAGFYETNMVHYEGLYRNPPHLIGIFAAQLASAFLLAYIFQKWANIYSFSSGVVTGALISFLIILSFDISIWAFMNLFAGKKIFVLDILLNTAMGGVIGGVIGFILGYKKA